MSKSRVGLVLAGVITLGTLHPVMAHSAEPERTFPLESDEVSARPRSPTSTLAHAQLTAPDGSGAAGFGRSVSVDGDTTVIGAPYESRGGKGEIGSAYVFLLSGGTWALQAKLVAADGAAGDWFGVSVAISGDTVVIGSSLDDTPPGGEDAGSAYVFVRSGETWTQEAKLKAPDGARKDYFGTSVALDANTALIGATQHSDYIGAAYVFVRSGSTWSGQSQLTPDGSTINFGTSVGLDADTAVIGSVFDDVNLGGVAYIFVRSGEAWTRQAKLTDDGLLNSFGATVALDGDTSLIGAPGTDTPAGVDAGVTHVFVRSGGTWTEEAQLVAGEGTDGDGLGGGVALNGDVAMAGAGSKDTAAGSDAGAVYVFRRAGTTWSQAIELIAPDGQPNDNLGWFLSFDGVTLVAGAWRHDTPAARDAGAAYLRWA